MLDPSLFLLPPSHFSLVPWLVAHGCLGSGGVLRSPGPCWHPCTQPALTYGRTRSADCPSMQCPASSLLAPEQGETWGMGSLCLGSPDQGVRCSGGGPWLWE